MSQHVEDKGRTTREPPAWPKLADEALGGRYLALGLLAGDLFAGSALVDETKDVGPQDLCRIDRFFELAAPTNPANTFRLAAKQDFAPGTIRNYLRTPGRTAISPYQINS